jgi:hypothetical protein
LSALRQLSASAGVVQRMRIVVAIGLLAGAMAVADVALRPTDAAGQGPGNGYTFHSLWNCGGIYSNQTCYSPGNCLGPSCAANHSFGWGSADEDVGASLYLRITAKSPSTRDFTGSGYDYVNACYYPNSSPPCNDQDSHLDFLMYVTHTSSGLWTIKGHGDA